MKNMHCPNCKNEYQFLKNKNHRCPFCGHIPKRWERFWADKANRWRILGGVLFINLVFIAIKTRLDGLIVLVIILTFNMAASLTSNSIVRHLRKRLEIKPPDSMIFPIPPFFNHALYFCILLLLPIMVLLPISWLNKANTQVDTGLGIGLPLMLSPILLFAVMMIRFNSGAVVLNEKEIIRYYPFTKKKMLLSDIQRINVNMFALPPGMSLCGEGHRITFPRAVQGYPELLKRLKSSTKLSTQGNKTSALPIQFPMTLEIPKRRMTIEILSMIGLVIIYLGIALSGLWGLLSNGHVPPFEGEDIKTILLVFLLISIIFVPMLTLGAMSSFSKKKPVQIVLSQEEIRIKYRSEKVNTYSTANLQKVWLQPVTVNMRSSFEGAVVRGYTTIYEVHLKFSGEEVIIFRNSEIRFLTRSPEQFVEIIHTLYKIG